MANPKRYYWLRLMSDFFTQPKIKKLRKIAGGDTYTIIYLKMQLLSLKNNAKLYFEGIEDNFIEEIALTIDEDIENVKVTVMYLIQQGLLEEVNENEFVLHETLKNIGSETAVAQRVRTHRKKQKEIEVLQCNSDVTACNDLKQIGNVEIEIEKEKELEIQKELDYMHEAENIIFMQLPLNTDELYPIYKNEIEEYKKLYPNVDVEQQIRCMKGWLDANQNKRKTKKGIKRFINGWLAREQDKPEFQKNNNLNKYNKAKKRNTDFDEFEV